MCYRRITYSRFLRQILWQIHRLNYLTDCCLFIKDACLRVGVDEEAVIDSGGVCRQVYGRVFETIGNGYLEIFGDI